MDNAFIRLPDQELALQTQTATPFSARRQIADALFRRKRAIVLLCAAFTLGVAVLFVWLPRSYQSEVLYLVKNTRAPIDLSGSPATSPTTPALVDDMQIGTEMQLLRSEDLHRKVTYRLNRNFGSLSDREKGRAVRKFDEKLRVMPVPKTSLIRVNYTAPTAAAAARALRILSEEYLDYSVRLHGNAGADEFFSQQAAAHLKRLNEAQLALAQFEAKTQISDLGRQKEITLEKLADTRAALGTVEADIQEARDRVDRLLSWRAQMQPRIVTQKRSLPNQYSEERLNTMLVELKNRRTALLNQYTPDDRRVVDLDKQIEETEKSLRGAESATATEEVTDLNPLSMSLETELAKARLTAESANARAASLQAQIAAYERELAVLRNATAEHDRLIMDEQEAKANYSLYNRKSEEARIADALDQQRIANVVLASGPTVPAFPEERLSSAVLVLLLGNLLIVGLVTAAGMRSATIHSSLDLEGLSNLQILATVPNDIHTDHQLRSIQVPAGELL